MRTYQKPKSYEPEEQGTLGWIWSGMLTFAQYALKHPVQVGIGLLLLSVPIILRQRQNATLSSDFDEYLVSNYSIASQTDLCRATSLPEVNILPMTHFLSESSLPADPIFTPTYLQDHHASLEKKNYYVRGDKRKPENLKGIIPPKCATDQFPHFDIHLHREDSECSGFVSLTSDMKVAHRFGAGITAPWVVDDFINNMVYFFPYNERLLQLYNNYIRYIAMGTQPYYIYMAEMERGLVIEDKWNPHSGEAEHSAIGSVPIVSFRKCQFDPKSQHIVNLHSQFKVGITCEPTIFVRKDFNASLKESVLHTFLLPCETLGSDKTPGSEKSLIEKRINVSQTSVSTLFRTPSKASSPVEPLPPHRKLH